MAIDWTAVTTGLVGLTGTPEYRVENDGLVRWRGSVTFTVASGAGTNYFPLPAAAVPSFASGAVALLFDWAAAPNLGIYVDSIRAYLGWQGGWMIGSVMDLSRFIYQGTAPPPAFTGHSLGNVIAGLATALDAIPDLRVYPYPADKVESPAVALTLPDSPFSIVQGAEDSYQWTFPLWLFVGKADDRSSAAELIPYLEPVGDSSIVEAIEADRTLGGACDSVSVLDVTTSIASVAGTTYLAAEFTLEVIG